ncbi:MAG: efflux RND transporter periplasmic adaptor subunit [Odoribacter splanchnicus]|nr:efflux RND transporter periplasmic adaptor subunit [Odoribacter splanchnicus]
MDTIIEKKRGFRRKHWGYAGGGVLLVVLVLYLVFRDTSSALRVERDRLTIETVEKGEFNDYIRVIGHVMPSRIIYIDAVEGGRVEERIVEEGTMVKKGDVILRLSNPLLNISIMQSEADLAYQENELRNTRINMEQERLRLKQERIGLATDLTLKKRRAEQYKRLFAKELVAKEEYLQAQEAYALAEEQLKVVDERIVQDERFREMQVKSLDENIANMKRSLTLVRERLENLKIKAPVDGQLGNLDAQIGQSINAGERIGQVITADLKIQAPIDEHYVERVMPELPAGFERDSRSYQLVVTKVYPEVKEGQFKTDMIFTGNRPENIRAGQTYHINLQLGDPVTSLLVPRGSFFQVTGGDWIYVLDDDGVTARRRKIRIGRQNPQYYEVLEGLQEGEQVVTSGYDTFGDNERLIIK